VEELGSRNAIKTIYSMLERGSGADRQLKVFRETGSLMAVVDYMVAETKAGL
jgi:carboxylate-amine ligase